MRRRISWRSTREWEYSRAAAVLIVLIFGVLVAMRWGVDRHPPPRPPRAAAPAPPLPLSLADLAAGARLRQLLPPGETRGYTFPLRADDYLHLVVEQRGVDVAPTLLDPAGRRLLRVDSPNEDNGPEDLFLVAGVPGRYLLEISSPADAGSAGRYEIRVESLRVATSADRERAAAADAFSRARLIQREENGPLEAAVAGYREAARLWHKLEDVDREAWALYRLGRIYGDDPGRRREGAEILIRAVDLFGKVDPRQQAVALSYLGDAWLYLGELDRAGRAYGQALVYWETQGDLSEQAPRLNDLAVVRRRQGRTHAAIDLYSRAIEVWRELGSWSDLATTHANLGVLYATLGENRLALGQYRRALSFLERKPDPEQRAVILTKQGDVLLKAAGPEWALQRYKEALALLQQRDTFGQGVALNGIGRARLAANRPREALRPFRSAVQIFRRVGDEAAQAVALSNLGRAYEGLGDPGRARKLYEQAFALSPKEEVALFSLARVARAEGRFDEAERWMERTLDAVESVRSQVWRPDLRSSYHASRQEHYASFIDLLAERHRREPERGHAAKAFAISERARARGLLDLLSMASQSPDREELRRFDELSRQVNASHLNLMAAASQGIENDALEMDLADGLESLRQARAEVQGPPSGRAGPPTLSLEQVQARLIDEETLLLEYFLGEERSFLWAVTPSAVRFVATLPGRAKIEELAHETYRRMIESHQQTGEVAARQAAERLSRMLLGPVADLLDRRRLIIVAPGALQRVPFAALSRPTPGGRVEPHPLIVDHEIVSLPSASVLATLRARLRNRKPPSGLLAVMADPVFGPEDVRLRGRRVQSAAAAPRMPLLGRLHYTGPEAEAILALAGPEPVLGAFGFEANRQLVRSGRLSGYRILHFATHGLFNDVYPELSALALSTYDASGRPVDGHLRAYEVSDLELHADLVVLSACRTGLGKDVGGEGLVGLTQGFLHAGAPRLVVSLWDVNDRATGELMKRFYTALLSQDLPPAQALRQAQLSLWREDRWRAPYYWAGFTFQGEWN